MDRTGRCTPAGSPAECLSICAWQKSSGNMWKPAKILWCRKRRWLCTGGGLSENGG